MKLMARYKQDSLDNIQKDSSDGDDQFIVRNLSSVTQNYKKLSILANKGIDQSNEKRAVLIYFKRRHWDDVFKKQFSEASLLFRFVKLQYLKLIKTNHVS